VSWVTTIRSITTDQIGLLFADGRDVYLITNEGKKFIIDTRWKIWRNYWSKLFFRANRSYILNIHFIPGCRGVLQQQAKDCACHQWEQEVIVSRER